MSAWVSVALQSKCGIPGGLRYRSPATEEVFGVGVSGHSPSFKRYTLRENPFERTALQ
jgi:hypothetical protein